MLSRAPSTLQHCLQWGCILRVWGVVSERAPGWGTHGGGTQAGVPMGVVVPGLSRSPCYGSQCWQGVPAEPWQGCAQPGCAK